MKKTRWGANNPNTRLTQEQVNTIKKLYDMGNTSCKKLGYEFFVSAQTIHNILTGKSWHCDNCAHYKDKI